MDKSATLQALQLEYTSTERIRALHDALYSIGTEHPTDEGITALSKFQASIIRDNPKLARWCTETPPVNGIPCLAVYLVLSFLFGGYRAEYSNAFVVDPSNIVVLNQEDTVPDLVHRLASPAPAIHGVETMLWTLSDEGDDISVVDVDRTALWRTLLCHIRHAVELSHASLVFRQGDKLWVHDLGATPLNAIAAAESQSRDGGPISIIAAQFQQHLWDLELFGGLKRGAMRDALNRAINRDEAYGPPDYEGEGTQTNFQYLQSLAQQVEQQLGTSHFDAICAPYVVRKQKKK